MFSIRYTLLTFIFFIQLFFYNNWMNGNWIIILISLIPIFTSMKMVFKKNYKNNIKNSLFLSISVIFGIYILLYGVHNIGIEFEKAIPIFSGEGNSICGIFNPTVNTCHKKK